MNALITCMALAIPLAYLLGWVSHWYPTRRAVIFTAIEGRTEEQMAADDFVATLRDTTRDNKGLREYKQVLGRTPLALTGRVVSTVHNMARIKAWVDDKGPFILEVRTTTLPRRQ